MNITIGPIEYAIEIVPGLRGDDGKRLWGEVKWGECRICIKAENHVAQRRQTLWHEIVHIILSQAGRQKDSQREALIEALAYGLMTVVQAHPWLAEEPK